MVENPKGCATTFTLNHQKRLRASPLQNIAQIKSTDHVRKSGVETSDDGDSFTKITIIMLSCAGGQPAK